jgi:hypothetical protein
VRAVSDVSSIRFSYNNVRLLHGVAEVMVLSQRELLSFQPFDFGRLYVFMGSNDSGRVTDSS